jgi:hypothetical protein
LQTTTRDGSLESTANYGAGAIDDEIDVEEGTSTPQGEASELPEERKRRIGVSLDRSKKVRVKPPEE